MIGAEQLLESGATDVLVALAAVDPDPDAAMAEFGELVAAFAKVTR